MNIGWCFPDRQRCGIAIYANNYMQSISGSATVTYCNTDTWYSEKRAIIHALNRCDLIHIQYETAFFLTQTHDFYRLLISLSRKPVIVSLHELYRQFPGVYQRDRITGNPFVKPLKYLIYDMNHPFQSAFRQHVRFHFGADIILVHHRFQKNILIDLNVSPDKILIMPMPVIDSVAQYTNTFSVSKPVVFGTTGFVNPHFNIPLLMSLLEKLQFEWKFVWIGDVRTEEHRELLNKLRNEINSRNWNDRFTITGWVDDAAQTRLLNDIDLYLAFFSHRSSSASLARALGARRLILALDSDMTREIKTPSGTSPLMIVEENIDNIIDAITLLLSSDSIRSKQIEAVNEYVYAYSFNRMGKAIVSLYELVSKKAVSQHDLPEEIRL